VLGEGVGIFTSPGRRIMMRMMRTTIALDDDLVGKLKDWSSPEVVDARTTFRLPTVRIGAPT
jgi:hypothetical protein